MQKLSPGWGQFLSNGPYTADDAVPPDEGRPRLIRYTTQSLLGSFRSRLFKVYRFWLRYASASRKNNTTSNIITRRQVIKKAHDN